MAEGETNPPHNDIPAVNNLPLKFTPEEQAAFNQALEEALGTMDLSHEFKASGLMVETAPDGSQTIKFPEGSDDDAFLNSALLPPFEAGDALPTSENGDQAMGLFDKHRICLCSEVTGVITQDGKPVVGAEVIRRARLFLPADEINIDHTLTDANGRFDFKPSYAKHWKHTLSEVRTDQKILIRHEGKMYLGWGNVSSGRDLHRDVFSHDPENFYIRLDFNGDLSRATPLPESAANGVKP